MRKKPLILTGPQGSGKTYTANAILSCFDDSYVKTKVTSQKALADLEQGKISIFRDSHILLIEECRLNEIKKIFESVFNSFGDIPFIVFTTIDILDELFLFDVMQCNYNKHRYTPQHA